MNTQNIMNRLQESGLRLFLEGGRLRATPATAITDAARALIKEHKAALVELLRSGIGGGNPPSASPPAPAPHTTAPHTTAPTTEGVVYFASGPTDSPKGDPRYQTAVSVPFATYRGQTFNRIDPWYVLDGLQKTGLSIHLDGDELRATPEEKVTDATRAMLAVYGPAVIEYLRGNQAKLTEPERITVQGQVMYREVF